MFEIGWGILQPKGNIIAPIVFILAKKTPKMRGSFAMKPTRMSMLKAIYGILRDPGTICMHKILTCKTLIFVLFQGPSGMRKIWVMALNFPKFCLLAI